MLDYSEHYGTLWGPVIDVGGGQVCVWEVRCLTDESARCLPSMWVLQWFCSRVVKGRIENNKWKSINYFCILWKFYMVGVTFVFKGFDVKCEALQQALCIMTEVQNWISHDHICPSGKKKHNSSEFMNILELLKSGVWVSLSFHI